MIKSVSVSYSPGDYRQAIEKGFNEIESMDEIALHVYANAKTMKDIIIEAPDEVEFDYIPNGIGYIRTAYLKFHPGLRDGSLKITNDTASVVVRVSADLDLD